MSKIKYTYAAPWQAKPIALSGLSGRLKVSAATDRKLPQSDSQDPLTVQGLCAGLSTTAMAQR